MGTVKGESAQQYCFNPNLSPVSHFLVWSHLNTVMRTLTNNHNRPGSSQVWPSSQPPESQELVTEILPHTQIKQDLTPGISAARLAQLVRASY